MGYQVRDTTAGIDKAMKLVRPSMKGMPNRSQYLKDYNEMRRKVAFLLMTIADGEAYFDPDREVRKRQRFANSSLRQ